MYRFITHYHMRVATITHPYAGKRPTHIQAYRWLPEYRQQKIYYKRMHGTQCRGPR